MDIFFLEAMLNGMLLGGLLALLALGLNLIFGVIDVVWICYAELVMVGMYGIYYALPDGWPLGSRASAAIRRASRCSASLLHQLVIRPVLDAAPINQLLVTGGVLFFLQAAATMAFGIEFRNIGIRLRLDRDRRHVFSAMRASSRSASRSPAMLVLWLFLTAHLHRHGDPRDLAGPQIMPLMGVDQRKHLSASPRRSAAGSRDWPRA